MRKILSSALLTVGAASAILVVPTGTASAMDPACLAAADIINSYSSLGPRPYELDDAATRLRAIEATGDVDAAIDAYADALQSRDNSMVGQAVVVLNGMCARTA
ncbi:hypothetical protein ACWDOP_17500 [Nocardia sp. NPDC003693]